LELLKEQNTTRTVVVNKSNSLSQTELDKLVQNSYGLDQNIPNPFSDITSISYSLPESDKNASILLLNLNGQLIKEFKLKDAKGAITISSGELQKGIYLYSLVSNNSEIITKKMILK
jgi:hypothetical protein